MLRVKVSKPYGESTVAKILDLVENSSAKKAKAENFITRFARYYTPAVVFAALALAILPPVLGFGPFSMWVQRALIFLVVSCPCALVISVPLSFFGGIGGASRVGVLVKGGNYLEALAKTGVVVMDKTGTLTRGSFAVTQTKPVNCSERELLEWAALAEHFSSHPISLSIQAACQPAPDQSRVTDGSEIAGHGVKAMVDGRTVLAGNEKWMDANHIARPQGEKPVGTVVHVAVDGAYAGHLVVADQIKDSAAPALKALKEAGVRQTVMLTGDDPAVAQAVGGELGLGQGLEGGGQQAVTGQDRGGLPVDHVVGRTAPAQLVVVHGGQIVVNERIGVDHLHRAGKGQGSLRITAAHTAALQYQHRSDAFASRHQRVLHRLPQVGVAAHLAYSLPQSLFHPSLGGLIVQAKYVLFHYSSS